MNTTLISRQGVEVAITVLLILRVERCGTCGVPMGNHILYCEPGCVYITSTRN